ncbi:class I SAM-dependent methyltransferase family protein [Candidatus Woesearchaeota archaeon]|nr:class I SAM-dependent methyltransferase family protein [Candidatus Woesearchaeota archaeon]
MPTLKEHLKTKLTKKQLALVPSSFDMLGDLAIFSDFPKELKDKEKLIAESLLKLHKNIKVVLKKTRKYSGDFRTPKLKILAGERRKETELNENNVRLKLDPEKAYFSIRLATERKRISEQVKENEDILVLFSGVGPYPLVIAKNKKPKIIYSVEINPLACKYQKENILANKAGNIKLFQGDVKKIVPKLKKRFDRILMPLPRGAENYLATALKAAKKGSIIHFYDFLHENEFSDAEEKIDKACKKEKKRFRILNLVKCGQFGPGIYRVCVDFRVIN